MIENDLLREITRGDCALFTAEQISRKLKIGKRELRALRESLCALVESGKLFVDSRMRYGTAEQFGAKRGTLSANERGFAFFIPEDGSGDLFLPRKRLNGALHGDTVLAFATGYGDEGEVLAVLKRGMPEVVGTYRRDHGRGYLSPDERRFGVDIAIPDAKSRRCASGSKAVVRITAYGERPTGEIVEILGKSGDMSAEERALIRAHGLRENFPAEAEREAKRVSTLPIAPACDGRLDLRDRYIITVDGEDTRDIDDAISVTRSGEHFELGVHIADVSHYVARNRALDREAFARGTSVYFPDRVLPMLPTALSNGICSLNEGEDRLTLSCIMTVDAHGNVLAKRVRPSVIRSRRRMTYSDVQAVYDGDPDAVRKYPDLVPFLKDAMALTHILIDVGYRRGALDFAFNEVKIVCENGAVTVRKAERTLAHRMIEQFMILANECVAELMTERGVPFVYRIHERPPKERCENFLSFLNETGISARLSPQKVAPADFQRILKSTEGNPLRTAVGRMMLRTMAKARYSPENIGHFGLASKCYCHFTSPIRRYPDLVVHRIVKEALKDPEQARKAFGTFVREAAEHSSVCERNAMDAERDVDNLYIVREMERHIGETYEATLSGVTAFGLFAELENGVEGLIPLETLPGDRYDFYENRCLLQGTRESFCLGQHVRIFVAGVDWGTRRVFFGLRSGRKRT